LKERIAAPVLPEKIVTVPESPPTLSRNGTPTMKSARPSPSTSPPPLTADPNVSPGLAPASS
jgi:hypothetical protein